MSIKTQIERISANVTNSIAAIESKGVEVPAGSNSDALPTLIEENLMKNITVDNQVTPDGTNPVSGAAVAAYTAQEVSGEGTQPVSGAAVYSYAQKKVTASTAELTAGSSALADGEVYVTYE